MKHWPGYLVVFVAVGIAYAQPNAIETTIGDMRAGFKGGALATDLDLESNSLICDDADASNDTKLVCDTDDEISVEINGAEDFRFSANAFTAQTGSSIVTPTLSAAAALAIGSGGSSDTTIDGGGELVVADTVWLNSDSLCYEVGAGGASGDASMCWDSDSFNLTATAIEIIGTLLATSTVDLESYVAIGNGSAVDAKVTALVDRDFSSATTASQLGVLGIATITGGTSSVDVVSIVPSGVVLNDGGPGVHPRVSSLYVTEPVVTETVGTATEVVNVYVGPAATEGDNNYSVHVVGASIFDAALDVDGNLNASAGVDIDADSQSLCLGAADCSDSDQSFDGTDYQFSCAGCTNGFQFNAPVIVGPMEAKADSGELVIWNQEGSGSCADNTVLSGTISLDSSADASFKISAQCDGAGGVDTFDVGVPSYSVDYVVGAGQATLGPTGPSWTANDSCVGATFDADAEQSWLYYEVPDCYADGNSDDLTIRIYWCGEDAQHPAQNEVVKWDISYRVLVWNTEDVDASSATTGTVSYTEADNPGDEGDTYIHEITIDADDADNPINAGDTIAIQFDRDWGVANNYPHDAIVVQWEIDVPQTSLICDHQ
jgi:hypothetical protein